MNGHAKRKFKSKRNKESTMARKISRLVKFECRLKLLLRRKRTMMLRILPSRPKVLTIGRATLSKKNGKDITTLSLELATIY